MESDEFDLFISYAAVDDKLTGDWKGWVCQFVDALRYHLSESMLGDQPNIYFDQRSIEPNDPTITILEACRRSKLFLSISSPSYQVRPWPKKELEAFCSVHPDQKSRFVIDIRKFDEERIPELESRHHGRFYDEEHVDPHSHSTMPLKPGSEIFTRRVDSLAKVIAKQLKDIKAASPKLMNKPVTNRMKALADGVLERQTAACKLTSTLKPVLLAQVTSDLLADQRKVREFLLQEGCVVLPKDDYPLGAAEFKAAYDADLTLCGMVVQLLGPYPSLRQPNLSEGFCRYQANAAIATGKPLMQWIRPDIRTNDEGIVSDLDQRKLLTESPNVIVSTREEFRGAILERLKKLSAPPLIPIARTDESFLIYIHNDSSHRNEGAELLRGLSSLYEVKWSDGHAPGNIRAFLEEGLTECQALLLLHGDPDSDWVYRELAHAKKVREGRPVWGAICYGPNTARRLVGYSFPKLEHTVCTDTQVERWDFSKIFAAATQWKDAHDQSKNGSRA